MRATLVAVSPVILGAVQKLHRFDKMSFLETDAALSQKLEREEQEAKKQAASAQEAWKESQAQTNAILAKVHSEMAALNSDLDKTAEEQKRDIVLLQKSHDEENAALEATERKLKELEQNAKITKPVVSSFISDDFLAPLRKAAAEAKAFAEKIRKESTASSFLENGDDYNSKAKQSLAMAKEALSQLDTDLQSQKRKLAAETAKAAQDEAALRELASQGFHPSFLQTGESRDPLSPEVLAAWREKFTAQLDRARKSVGLAASSHSSFAELNTNEDAALDADAKKVASLQAAYDAQMEKLKGDNAKLLEQARSEMDLAKKMKSELESKMKESSFLESSSSYDVNKEQEHIRELKAKWQKQAEALANPGMKTEGQKELEEMMERQRIHREAADQELGSLSDKLRKDIDLMHKDMVAAHVSFLQEDSVKPASQKLLDHAKSLITTINHSHQPYVPAGQWVPPSQSVAYGNQPNGWGPQQSWAVEEPRTNRRPPAWFPSNQQGIVGPQGPIDLDGQWLLQCTWLPPQDQEDKARDNEPAKETRQEAPEEPLQGSPQGPPQGPPQGAYQLPPISASCQWVPNTVQSAYPPQQGYAALPPAYGPPQSYAAPPAFYQPSFVVPPTSLLESKKDESSKALAKAREGLNKLIANLRARK